RRRLEIRRHSQPTKEKQALIPAKFSVWGLVRVVCRETIRASIPPSFRRGLEQKPCEFCPLKPACADSPTSIPIGGSHDGATKVSHHGVSTGRGAGRDTGPRPARQKAQHPCDLGGRYRHQQYQRL